jgi:exodeoxyribonuclease VII large subunit
VDLWWLNDLELARTLCNTPLPCFTEIGHVRDSTILDEIAHQKFDTPSKVALHISRTIRDNALAAVAHAVAEDVEHTAATVQAGALGLIQVTAQDMEHSRDRVTTDADGRCCDAEVALQRAVDRLGHRAQMALAARESDVGELGRVVLTRTASRLDETQGALDVLSDCITRDAGHQAALAATSLDHQAEDVCSGTASALRAARTAVEMQAGRVLGLGPEATLRRGFTLVHDAEGKPVTSRATAAEHRELHIQFHDGTLRVENRENTGSTTDG